MKRNYIGEINNKNILFLQGPMGGFFKRLDLLFRTMGAKTCKIGFNAGDCFFSNRDNYIPYRGRREDWPEYVATFLKTHRIDQIYLFGDCRFYQRHAIDAAKALGIEVFVFEEGYVRPDYITLEKYGVNDYSRISRSRAFYDHLSLDALPEPSAEPAHFSQPRMVGSAVVYYALSNLLFFRYPHYRHHRGFSALKELFIGARSLLRKWYYRWSERKRVRWIEAEAGNYFFVPLQTYNDFQILEHSGYGAIEKFIGEVLDSFARCAPEGVQLVFKHHPVDRGRKNYTAFILRHAELFNISKRVHVLYDVHLPTLLKNAVGTVTINSTVGLSSLYHGTPTITLGNAIYDIEGLTCRGMDLDGFWREQRAPDRELFEKYRRFLIQSTQLNGSFYGEMPDFGVRRVPYSVTVSDSKGMKRAVSEKEPELEFPAGVQV
jgi:capsular polysaccharide export protein